jgi:AraC family transcriptional regulator
MDIRRAWGGLEVVLVDTPAGATRAAASSKHRIGFHVGRPVRAVCKLDGRTHRRLQSRGDMDLVPAGMPGVWEDDRSTRILRMSVSPELLRSAAEGMGVDSERVELAPRFQLRDGRLEHIAWALEAELTAEVPGDALYGESLGMALAVHLVRRYRTTSGALFEPTRGLSRPQLARVIEYIEENLGGRLLLAELAAVAGVSASHFKTQFKRSTGLPVHQYVVRRRVERARLLLARDGHDISDVAVRTGFTDASHLARWMRRALGVTPALVRRRGE